MVHAVLLDALGTMIELEPPWARLARALGDELAEEDVRAAFEVEMDYYRDHLHEGTDPESLAGLRERCAAVLSGELRREVGAATMMAAIRFRAYPDAVPALAELRRRGLRLVCVSNWDCSLPEVLRRTALAERLDAVVVSALHGAPKPDPGIFAAALELAGSRPDQALHVGDRDEDDAGARAAGVAALRIDRSGGGQIASLAEIVEHLDR
jgi:putative hydrolase of the HAD superfamily